MPLPSSTALLKGLLRYTLKQKIGSGGMATVYCANDHVLGREVALKMMHEHLINSPESVKRFSSEARAVATLSHENIVKIFDYGEINSRPYLVMEYVKGPSLQSFLEKSCTLPNLVALEVCRQVLMGLVCAHSKGVFHRDIKPDNIIIDEEGIVKIMDFGIAYIVNQESVTMTGSFIGSPRYISPEQAQGRPLSGTTDVFSAGVMLYVALTGKLPFDAEVAAAVVHSIIHDTPPPVYARNPTVLYWLSDLVEKLLRKDPLARPDSSAALSLIDDECRQQGIKTGRDRLRRFLDGPEKCRASEMQELFELYRTRARKAVRDRQITVALKSLEQAKCFGLLTKEDEDIIAAQVLHRHLKTLLRVALLLIVCGAGLYLTLRFVSARNGQVKMGQKAETAAKDSRAVNGLPRPVDTPQAAAQVKRAVDTTKRVRPSISSGRLREKTAMAAAAAADGSAAKVPFVTGYAKIQTNPPWAKVFIDNIERGVTPVKTIFPLPAGPHEVRIVKEGFPEYRKTFTVSVGDTIPVRVQLAP